MTAPHSQEHIQNEVNEQASEAKTDLTPDCCSTDLLAPVHTIFPELKISAVVLGSRILMITAANR